MPRTMRVARLHAPGDVRVETAPVPEPGAGELVIRVDACGLCGSDALDWYVARKAPVVLGHEPVGVVVAVGDGVDPALMGRRVFVHHHAPCMKCEECRRRLWSSCATWKATQLRPGGFAEFTCVSAPSVAHDLLPLPDTMSDDIATFIEPVACCLRALDKARVQPDDTVLVVGLGAMGLVLGQLARLRTDRPVLGVDPRSERRTPAERFGMNTHESVQDAVHGSTDGRGADVVIVTPGSTGAVTAGIGAAAPGARVVCFTPLDPDQPLLLDQSRLYFREIELLQSYSCGPDETRRSLDLLASGVIDVAPLVTHHEGLGGVGVALARAHDATGIKTVILPWSDGLQDGAAAS